ncbi:hypothetical protein [Desulfonatronum thiodismutans]|uniref:hypothetical protein n=1 Tax=Desulfonatronum thiodismutans TaxID=159290 RepID=UPI0004ABE637|nr:hypothetical protein [Desulfonatronum thiodismutans]
MELTNISRHEMTAMMKEAFASVLSERRDLLEEAVEEAILDMKFGLAIEDGDSGEYVSEKAVFEKLRF